jgi:hypothetical protein
MVEHKFFRTTDLVDNIWQEQVLHGHLQLPSQYKLCLYPQSSYCIFTEYHSVFPLVGIWTLPPPHSPASVPLPPEPTGVGGGTHYSLRVWGCGSPNSDDWRKGLALCLICAPTPYPPAMLEKTQSMVSHLAVSFSKVWPSIRKWYT